MATVTALTSTRTLAIEAASIVNGAMVSGDLILTRGDGTTINAGTAAPESVPMVQVTKNSGNTTLAIATVWTDLDNTGSAAAKNLDVVLTNMVIGDQYDFTPFLTAYTANGAFYLNLAIIKAGVMYRRLFDASFGYFPWNTGPNITKDIVSSTPRQTVLTGDLDGTGLRLRLQYLQATVTRAIYSQASVPLWLEGRGPYR